MDCFAYGNKNVYRNGEGLTQVPQDIDVRVRKLYLEDNAITILDRSGFPLYTLLEVISLSHNKITAIHNGVFDNNPLLEQFYCNVCVIKSLPSSFGPATSTISTIEWRNGISDINVLKPSYFRDFTSMKKITLSSMPLDDMKNISLPASITYLDVSKAQLTIFPNLSSVRYPALNWILLHRNKFTNISDAALNDISESLTRLVANYGELEVLGDVTVLPNLKALEVMNNNLETVPDFLHGVPLLQRVQIRDNKRMSCDRRMCWWRLWDRVRAPIKGDEVMCVTPQELAGYSMMELNPKFMDCIEGTCIQCRAFMH